MRGRRLDGLPKDYSGETQHGTHDGYVNHGCRCPLCRRAWREYYRESLADRASRAPCSVGGCGNGLYAKGLCKPHYERQRRGRPLAGPVGRRPNAYGYDAPGKTKEGRSS